MHHDNGLILSQRKFAKDMLAEFDDVNLHIQSSPLPPHLQLKANEGELLSNPLRYRQLIGKLNYLTHTRLDLLFAVQIQSQFMQEPRHSHWNAILHTLSYVKAHIHKDCFLIIRILLIFMLIVILIGPLVPILENP